jgi:hypothetical protein
MINWMQFKHPLKRRKDIDWENIKNKKHNLQLKKIGKIKNKELNKFYNTYK